jgi:hypothetical protein
MCNELPKNGQTKPIMSGQATQFEHYEQSNSWLA